MLPTVCFTSSYSPNDEYPSMKIATEDILSGLLPKFPSALLLRGHKRCKILSQGELRLVWKDLFEIIHIHLMLKIYLAVDPFWCCWSAARPVRKCNDFQVWNMGSLVLNSDSPVWSKDSLIYCRGYPICCRCSRACCMVTPACHSSTPTWSKDSLICSRSPNNSWKEPQNWCLKEIW